MAVSRTRAAADYRPTAPAADRARGGPPYPSAAIPVTDQALWARVIRHARCTASSLDPDQWFPISASIASRAASSGLVEQCGWLPLAPRGAEPDCAAGELRRGNMRSVIRVVENSMSAYAGPGMVVSGLRAAGAP
jgi:hypothetical protein